MPRWGCTTSLRFPMSRAVYLIHEMTLNIRESTPWPAIQHARDISRGFQNGNALAHVLVYSFTLGAPQGEPSEPKRATRTSTVTRLRREIARKKQ